MQEYVVPRSIPIAGCFGFDGAFGVVVVVVVADVGVDVVAFADVELDVVDFVAFAEVKVDVVAFAVVLECRSDIRTRFCN